MAPKILIVDDSMAMRAVLVRALTMAGYDHYAFEEADGGESALLKIRTSPPRLVLSDWSMPVMSGIELLRAIRACGIHVRHGVQFGFVASGLSVETRAMAQKAGALFIVNKPFTVADIQAALEPVLGPPQGAAEYTDGPRVKPATIESAPFVGYRIKGAQAVGDALSSLAQYKRIAAKERAVTFSSEDRITVAAYRRDGSPAIGVCACDLKLGTYLGLMLSGIPAVAADGVAKAGAYPSWLANNLREVFNVLTCIFESSTGEVLKLAEITEAGVAPRADVLRVMKNENVAHMDLSVDVPGYGVGRMTLCLEHARAP